MKRLSMRFLETTLLASGVLLLTACGGGGGDTSVPVADTFTPDEGTLNVRLDTTVSAVFDEAMIDLSIAEDSFYLKSENGTEINATVDYDSANDTATLTPRKPLALLTHYTATLTNGNLNLASSRLAETSWGFQTRDGIWQGAQNIESNRGSALSSHVSMDSEGNAIAIWTQDVNRYRDVWVSHYSAATKSWGEAIFIGAATQSASAPQIAMNASGDAFAIWMQKDIGGNYSIWVNHFRAGHWRGATHVEDAAATARDPHIAINASGNAMAVWRQEDRGNMNIYARFFSNNSWGDINILEHGHAGNAFRPRVSLSDNNSAIVVWTQKDDAGYLSIYTNRFTGEHWRLYDAQLLEHNEEDAMATEIAIDHNGNALAVWHQSNGMYLKIHASYYSASLDSWNAERKLENTDNHALMAQVSFDGSGNAIVVWQQFDDRYSSIYMKRFTSSGWGRRESVEFSTGSATSPQVSVDASGNAIAVWHHFIEGIFYTVYSRYTAETGTWGAIRRLEEAHTGHARSAQIIMNGSGEAIAIWEKDDGRSSHIKANIFK